MTTHKTNFKVSLDLDVILDDRGVYPDVILRDIRVTHTEVERYRYVNEELEDGEKDE